MKTGAIDLNKATREELLDRIEDLEIRYKQVGNDLAVTQEEKNENALKYLELMSEVEEKNRELTELKENLESLVKEKTAELLATNDSLRSEVNVRKEFQEKAEKMAAEARKANAAKSEFLANMSHEIRTPLNAIINMTGIVLETELMKKQRDRLETVLSSSRHLLTVINDILDFSKIEAGKLEIETIDFNLHKLMDSTIETMKTAAEKKGLDLAFSIEPDVPNCLLGDENRIRQILINLIGNALKFTEKGSIKIHVCNVSGNESEIQLRFSVRDSGIGIPPDKQQKIFDYFSQVDSSISRRFGGTGLGLAICRQLVMMMGGKIWVESEEGQGSTFFFTICLSAGNPENIREVKSGGIGKSRTTLRILLAEDNKVNVEIALHFLTQMGHQTAVAENGFQAVEMLSKAAYDLVLMDVEMPIYDGFEATRRIRAGESGEFGKSIPIIAMTAHAISGFREQCLEAGMNDYLTKPVDPVKLGQAIQLVAVSRENASNAQAAQEPSSKTSAPSSQESIDDPSFHLDIRKALKLYNDNVELINILCNVFQSETPGVIAKIETALNTGDAKTAMMNSHSLKSSAAAVGATHCSEICAKLEALTKVGNVTEAAQLFSDLSAEYVIVKNLLEKRG